MVVYKDSHISIVWNESATFNVFVDNRNVDVFTSYDVAGNPTAARALALEYVEEPVIRY